MSEEYKKSVKEVCNNHGLIPFLVDGEFHVYQSLEEILTGDDPITVFCYRDPDTWTRDIIEDQILEALIDYVF